jgi:phytoene/squalene synthetase
MHSSGCAGRKRNALCALYAFMRLIDDVSDEPGDLESKRQGLGSLARYAR